jgi:hypothetical protein
MTDMSSGGGFKFSFGTAPSRKESEAVDPENQSHNAAEEVLPADAQAVCPTSTYFNITLVANVTECPIVSDPLLASLLFLHDIAKFASCLLQGSQRRPVEDVSLGNVVLYKVRRPEGSGVVLSTAASLVNIHWHAHAFACKDFGF